MEHDNKIKNYSAADIEKYHKRLLSSKEMREMEMAALDDPLLADALEGYALTNLNVETEVAELKNRLSERIEGDRKIIPITRGGRSFKWLRAAAVIVIVAGSGLLVYKLGFNNKSKEIAQAPLNNKEESEVADTSQKNVFLSRNDSNTVDIANSHEKDKLTTEGFKTSPGLEVKQQTGRGLIKTDTTFNSYALSTAQTTEPAKEINSKDRDQEVKKSERNDKSFGVLGDSAVTPQSYTYKADPNKKDLAKKSSDDNRQSTDTTKYQYDMEAKASQRLLRLPAPGRLAANQNFSNVFRGRIVDNNNNPVPFANITNTRDNVGTYSDAKGYFNLLSPDSVLNVQVRSLGYENNNTQLRNNVASNQVIMQDDNNKNLNEVVISSKKPNTALRSRQPNVKPEEPEPEDGWDNYDTYLANNLNVSDELKNKFGNGNVEISFEVNRDGDPVNLKIEKSLCEKCDQEVIRLIKAGPKWKQKNKKSRTTVTVSF